MPPRKRVSRQEPRNNTPPPQQEISNSLTDLYEDLREIPGQRAQQDLDARQASLFKDFVKLSPPTFDGKLDPTATEKWLRDIKKIFITIRKPAEFQWSLPFTNYLIELSISVKLSSSHNR
ncbi:hypothetical protein PanWU01x14_031790, partial [Parasponia andersonii]